MSLPDVAFCRTHDGEEQHPSSVLCTEQQQNPFGSTDHGRRGRVARRHSPRLSVCKETRFGTGLATRQRAPQLHHLRLRLLLRANYPRPTNSVDSRGFCRPLLVQPAAVDLHSIGCDKRGKRRPQDRHWEMPVEPGCVLREAGKVYPRNIGLPACSTECNANCDGRQKGTPTTPIAGTPSSIRPIAWNAWRC